MEKLDFWNFEILVDPSGKTVAEWHDRDGAAVHLGASNSPVIARLDRAIQYAAADVVRASSSTLASGILDRPVKPGDDNCICCGFSVSAHHVAAVIDRIDCGV